MIYITTDLTKPQRLACAYKRHGARKQTTGYKHFTRAISPSKTTAYYPSKTHLTLYNSSQDSFKNLRTWEKRNCHLTDSHPAKTIEESDDVIRSTQSSHLFTTPKTDLDLRLFFFVNHCTIRKRNNCFFVVKTNKKYFPLCLLTMILS